MWGKFQQVVLTVCIAAVVSSVFVIVAPAVGRRDAGADPAAMGDPWVKNGWKNGPVPVPKSLGPVTSMALPAGKYVVFAKLHFWNESGAKQYTDCKLTLGNSWDWAFQDTENAQNETIALSVAGVLTQAGRVYLDCRTSGSKVSANWIKIEAIRVGWIAPAPL